MSDITVSDRVSDAIALCELRGVPRFVGFLSVAEAAECTPILQNVKHRFFGGYESAERTFLGVFPNWCEAENEIYPIVPITFSFRTCDKLSHRDFLGAILSLGLSRETVGDILIEKGRAVAFVTLDIAEYILSQISKVGSVGVELSRGFKGSLPNLSRVLECSATVASLRADCVVSALISKSRNTAVELIEKALVSVNSVALSKPTKTILQNDIISIRGFGRFKITANGDTTKKGRIVLKYNKYI